MSEPFLGQIQLFSFNAIPKNFAACQGQLLAIVQNKLLYSLIGNKYGGDGITTFGLPNLTGAFVLSPSIDFPDGQSGGEAAHTLTAKEMPVHTHPMVGSTATCTTPALPPAGNFLAVANPIVKNYGTAADVGFGQGSSPGGGGQPHPNMPPYLVMSWCIALSGAFPSQN